MASNTTQIIEILAANKQKRKDLGLTNSTIEIPNFGTITLDHIDKKFEDDKYNENRYGNGGFATVKKVWVTQSNKQYALKIFNKSRHSSVINKISIDQIKREAEVLREIGRTSHVFKCNEKFYLLTNWIEGQDLFEIYARNRIEILKFDRLTRLQKFKQFFQDLKLLHSHGKIHGDLKPENVMFDPITCHLTLVDFNSTRMPGTEEINSVTLSFLPRNVFKEISIIIFSTRSLNAGIQALCQRQTKTYDMFALAYILVTFFPEVAIYGDDEQYSQLNKITFKDVSRHPFLQPIQNLIRKCYNDNLAEIPSAEAFDKLLDSAIIESEQFLQTQANNTENLSVRHSRKRTSHEVLAKQNDHSQESINPIAKRTKFGATS